jgi:hypothetical protein
MRDAVHLLDYRGNIGRIAERGNTDVGIVTRRIE